MGNDSCSRKIQYDLRVIFYGNTPQEIIDGISSNREISNVNNRYFFYEKYKWYFYLKYQNRNITSKEDIQNIIEHEGPSKNYRKNVIICFSQLSKAINLLQYFQKKFFLNNNVEDYNPYFIFNECDLNLNNQNQNLWNIQILFDEEKEEIINISAINQNLQLYQTDFYYEDFLRCKIFRNYNNLKEIFNKLQQFKNNNNFDININENTEKLEITFHINQRPNKEENNSDDKKDEKSSKDKEINCEEKEEIKIVKKYKIESDDYDIILTVEQNIFMHVSIVNSLENIRSIVYYLLDAANYYNYLPLNIDQNRVCYNGFNIILVGQSKSGKSILMNKIAGRNITHSSEGELRTEDIFMREICNGKINLYDTCGASPKFKPGDIFKKLQKKIELLKDNGEKMDLLLIVIKKGELPDKIIFDDLIIKMIRLNLNYLIVINHFNKINSIKKLIKETFSDYGCEIDDSNIVEVDIKKDITLLYRKIFEKFRNNRISSETFENKNLWIIENLSRYTRNNNLILYKDISFDMIFKRKNWEADKLYWKNLIVLTGSNFVPIVGIIYPLILTLKLVSDLHNIYLR